MLLSFSWKSAREFAGTEQERYTMHEKLDIAELIRLNGYNTERLGKWLVMVSGDMHMLAYDTGEFNPFGGFPIF